MVTIPSIINDFGFRLVVKILIMKLQFQKSRKMGDYLLFIQPYAKITSLMLL